MHDDVAELRAHWLGTVGEDATEVPEGTVRIVVRQVVFPSKHATVVHWVETHVLTGAGDWGRNEGFQNFRVEDDGSLELRVLVVRRDVNGASVGGRRGTVGVDADILCAVPVVTGRQVVDEVVVTTVAAGNTERLEKFRRVGPAEVLANICIVADKRTAGLSATDKGENGRTILTTLRVIACTLTNQLQVDAVENALGKVARSLNLREEVVCRWIITVGLRECASNNELVSSHADELVAVAVDPRPACVLRENRHDVCKLFLAIHRETEIVDADARRLQSGVLKVVGAERLSEVNSLLRRNARAACIAVHGASAVIDTINRELVCCDVIPRERVGWKAALVREYGNGVAHLIGPCALLNELEPR